MVLYRVAVTLWIDLGIDDAVLALSADGAWAEDFYGLSTPEALAEHLAWNVGVCRRDLSSLDGFADRADGEVRATVVDVTYDTERLEEPEDGGVS